MPNPDLSGPLSSNGGYENASGRFNLGRDVSRVDKSIPPTGGEDDATQRYFGSFSIESRRHVWDLLAKHPKFQEEGKIRKNRIINNTKEVLTNDPTKLVQNGGFTQYLTEENNDGELAES